MIYKFSFINQELFFISLCITHQNLKFNIKIKNVQFSLKTTELMINF